MKIYLLHIQPAYRHAQHYLGIADDLEARLALHRAGQSARLTQVVVEAGRKLVLVRTWDGERTDERRLKNQPNSPRLCPVCNPRLKGEAC
jgi:predicted GIY-YIG superfamily endonuclease